MATKIRVSNLHTDVKTMMQTMVDENAVDSADVTSIVNTNIASKSTSDISEGTNLYYTNARADARVALIVDAAPGTLNTLNELAAALGDDANFSTTVTNSIATKLPLAGGTITGNLTVDGDVTFFKNTGGSSTYDFVSDHYAEIALTADYDGSHGGPHITSLIANGSTGSLAMRTNNVNRLQVAQNGDVNFFDHTGANAKFLWDASTERLGIGTTTPNTKLDVAGDITVSGTVDGRDVATDGTKLDGIEAGATADQTTIAVSTAGSNVYKFTGDGFPVESGDNPNMYFDRGQTYVINNSQHASHPLDIRLSDGGAAYTSGVSGASGAKVTFTVPMDAPDKLVYQCTSHSAMVGNIYITGKGINGYAVEVVSSLPSSPDSNTIYFVTG